MIFDKINIRTALEKERARETTLMQQVDHILQLSTDRDADILKRLQKRSHSITSLPFVMDEADQKEIFSLEDIKAICIRYRLRFLDSSMFTAEIHYEAISKIANFEKKYNYKIEHFKIVAPDAVFKLEDVNKDPLLFADLGNNTYYLIHKWGNDMAWYRNILCFPFRSLYSFLISVYMVGLIIGFSLPVAWLNVKPEYEGYLRFWLSIHSFIGLSGFFIFVGATFNKHFSGMNWKSNYFNS